MGELTKLDNLVDQEDQYTKIIAKKIAALSPDIVFSTKNTSRSAWVSVQFRVVNVIMYRDLRIATPVK